MALCSSYCNRPMDRATIGTKENLAYLLDNKSAQHVNKITGIWVTKGNNVYDITDFVDGHPGGDKIFWLLENHWSHSGPYLLSTTMKIFLRFSNNIELEN